MTKYGVAARSNYSSMSLRCCTNDTDTESEHEHTCVPLRLTGATIVDSEASVGLDLDGMPPPVVAVSLALSWNGTLFYCHLVGSESLSASHTSIHLIQQCNHHASAHRRKLCSVSSVYLIKPFWVAFFDVDCSI